MYKLLNYKQGQGMLRISLKTAFSTYNVLLNDKHINEKFTINEKQSQDLNNLNPYSINTKMI